MIETVYDDIETLQQQVAALQTAVSTLQSSVSSIQSTLQNLSTWQASVDEALYDSGWINLPLSSGWSMNDYNSEVPKYRKIGKIVMLKGLVNATVTADRTIATLPVGYRPADNWYNRYNCILNQSEYANVQIDTNGNLLDYTKNTSTSRTFLCLNSVVFMTN